MEIDPAEKSSFSGTCNLGAGRATTQQQWNYPCWMMAALETITKDLVIIIPYSMPSFLPPLNSNLSFVANFTGVMSFDLFKNLSGLSSIFCLHFVGRRKLRHREISLVTFSGSQSNSCLTWSCVPYHSLTLLLIPQREGGNVTVLNSSDEKIEGQRG